MIKIICIGKVKESFYRDAIEEYIKRLSKYEEVKIIELADYGLLDEKSMIKKESTEVENNLNNKDYNIVLDINGKELDSIEFANKINEVHNTYSNITFIIGGSSGLTEELKNKCNYKLSFSKMTFPHQLFRVVLLEQIYRAYKINNNESYHK